MKRAIGYLIGLLAICTTATTFADELVKNVEASLLVTGTITVNPDGSVYDYKLNKPDKLPAGVVQLVSKDVPQWKFKPVLQEGKPIQAEAQMALRVVVHQNDKDDYSVGIRGASFGRDTPEAQCEPGTCVSHLTTKPPGYPIDAARAGAGGTVYLLIRIDRQGKVENLAVRQIDLRAAGSESELADLRAKFSAASLETARGWTFNIPTKGDEAAHDHWLVTCPVNFQIESMQVADDGREIHNHSEYGKWDVYVPGPVQSIPWADDEDKRLAGNGSADAIPDDGTPFMADDRIVLTTPLQDANVAPANAPQQAATDPTQG